MLGEILKHKQFQHLVEEERRRNAKEEKEELLGILGIDKNSRLAHDITREQLRQMILYGL